MKPELPNSSTVYALGLISIIFCWLWCITWIVAVITLTAFNRSERIIIEHGDEYDPYSINQYRKGKSYAKTGLIINILITMILFLSKLLDN